KGTRKPNLGGRRAGRLHTRQETRNLGLKAITDKSGPVPIRFKTQFDFYWVPKEDGTYDVERIRRGRPSHISEVDWDAQIAFWNDPKNLVGLPKINKTGQRARLYANRDPGLLPPSEICM
ncbi:hypothetical protein Tco_0050564, partial [Tanacetum coccineum]